MTLVASASVCIGFLWILFSIRGRIGSRVRPMALMCVFIAAVGAANVLRYAAEFMQGSTWPAVLASIMAGCALALGLTIWAFIPQLTREPTHSELVVANEDLLAERDARRKAVEELSKARDELERRVEERTRALELARRRFEIALEGTGIVVTHQDRDLRYTWMYNAPPPLSTVDAIGRLPEDVLPAELAAQQAAIKRRVIETAEAAKFEAIYPTSTGPIWYEGRVVPLLVGGALEGVMTVSIDVTRHMLHERQMRELMRELTHRSRNLLAVVQGMARQSSADATDIRVFIDGFDARLDALSRAHELLIDTNWRGVPLRAILEREFAPLAGRLPAPRVEGPDLQLSPEAAQTFALAINELSAELRAASPLARMDIAVSWRVDDGTLRFDWRRTGESGALIDGFGQNLLNRVLPRQIGGVAQLSFSQDACAYALEGRAALLTPVGRQGLRDQAAETQQGRFAD